MTYICACIIYIRNFRECVVCTSRLSCCSIWTGISKWRSSPGLWDPNLQLVSASDWHRIRVYCRKFARIKTTGLQEEEKCFPDFNVLTLLSPLMSSQYYRNSRYSSRKANVLGASKLLSRSTHFRYHSKLFSVSKGRSREGPSLSEACFMYW